VPLCFKQDQLLELQEAIGTSLEYFQELEHATRLLNHPGESLVLQTDFLYMIERVDICIEFLKSHVSYECYFGPLAHLASLGLLGNSETTKKQKYTSCASSNV
jgi:conserved oligomeric Golgi complex subunit COG3-like protein